MSITRPPAMTPDDAERIIGEAQRRGAVVRMEDPRVSGAIQWLLSAIGVAIVGGIGALMNGQAKTNERMAQINQNIAIMIQRQDFNDRVNVQQDKHLEAIDTRVDRNTDDIRNLKAQYGGGGRGGSK